MSAGGINRRPSQSGAAAADYKPIDARFGTGINPWIGTLKSTKTHEISGRNACNVRVDRRQSMKRWQRKIGLGAVMAFFVSGWAQAQTPAPPQTAQKRISAAKPAAQTKQKSGLQQEETQRAAREAAEAKMLLGMIKQALIYASVSDIDGWTARVSAMQPDADHPYIARYRAHSELYREDIGGKTQSAMPGAVTSFYVSFPYECPSSLDFGIAHPPETDGFDTSQATPRAMHPALNWMLYASVGNLGAVKPQERMHHPGFSVMYLASRIVIDSPSPVRAWIEIPSESPIVAWVNGERVFEQREEGPDELPLFGERREIVLNPGENILAVKAGSLEKQPGFYVFLTEAGTGKPLAFRVDNSAPIVARGALGAKVSAPSFGSIFSSYEASGKMTLAERALLTRLTSPPADAARIVGNLFMNDIDSASSMNPSDLALAAIVLKDPGKSLQILRKAIEKNPEDGVLRLLLARETALNSEAQGDTGSRFADEWPEIRAALQKEAPTQDGVSYEPLRAKLAALAELNAHQAMTAFKPAEASSCAPCAAAVLPLVAGTLESRGQQIAYQSILERLYNAQKNSAVYFVDMLDRQLRRAASQNDDDLLDDALASIQKSVESFFARHPYDDYVWNFWLDVVSAYGNTPANAEKYGAQSAPRTFQADGESQFMLYLSQRINDPSRWLRFARYCVETGNLNEAASAYEMAAQLVPQDESIAERANLAKRLINRDSADEAQSYETPYIVKDIPGNADPDASQFVSLLDNRVTRILPNGLSSTFNQIVFEVIDEQGIKTLRAMPINYSPSDEKLEILSVTATKKDGTVSRLYKTAEYNTADESIRMYYDQRQAVIEIPDLAVGDRIEYRFKRTQMQKNASSANYFSDLYQLRATFNRQLSKYTVIAPETFPIRILRHNPDGEPRYVGTQTKVGDSVVTTYEEKNAPRFVQEDNMPGITEASPFLLVSSFASWQDVADWFIDLAKPQWKTDEAIKTAVAELTAGVDDPLEKLKRIHNFVVKSTRYVALEFGIHGHKPYPVSQVFERRFGDCKDKASLLKAMLGEAGIAAQFVLIRTRRNGDVSMELPNAYLFDHAIVYVPMFDMFLDATAEFSGTRELPAPDQGANALIIDDDASYRLVKTPMTKSSDNAAVHHFTFDLRRGGAISYTDRATYKGLMAPSYRERYQVESLRRERLESEYAYGIAGTEIQSFEISDAADLERDVSLTVHAETSFSQIAKTEGNTWIVRLGAKLSHMAQSFAPSSSRHFALEQAAPMQFRQTVEFILPPGAKADIPAPQSQTTPLGQWSVNAAQKDNILTAEIAISLDKSKISPEEYPIYQDFLQRFDRAANAPCQIAVGE